MYTKENIKAFLVKRKEKLENLVDYVPDHNKRLLLVTLINDFEVIIDRLDKEGFENENEGAAQFPRSHKRAVLEELGTKTCECIHDPYKADKEKGKDVS